MEQLRKVDDAKAAEALARRRVAISVCSGHDASTVKPALMSALMSVSQASVDLCAKTMVAWPCGLRTRCISLKACAIMSSKNTLALVLSPS